jgi:hypothetical protein
MATAQRPGGLYVVNGKHVDADGKLVENPPELTPDTVPTPVGAAPVVPIAEQIAEGVAKAMLFAKASEPAPAATEQTESDEVKADTPAKGKK